MTVANPWHRAGRDGARGDGSTQAKVALSRRERQVLEELSKGATNVEIAAGLGVSVHTVKSYVKSILLKLDAKNRTAAAIRFERLRDGREAPS